MKNCLGATLIVVLVATMPFAEAQQDDIKKAFWLELHPSKTTRDHPLRGQAEAIVSKWLLDNGWQLRDARDKGVAEEFRSGQQQAKSAAMNTPAEIPDIIVKFSLLTSEQSEQNRETVAVGFHAVVYNAATSAKIGEVQEVSAARLRQPGELAAALVEAVNKALPRLAESLAAYIKRVEEQGFDVIISFNNAPEKLLIKTYSAVRTFCSSIHQDQQVKKGNKYHLVYTGRCKLTGHGLAEALLEKIKQADARLTPTATTAVRQMVVIDF